jgi:hypothetical protein
VKGVFSGPFKADLLKEKQKYEEISTRLASAFDERVAGQTRESSNNEEAITWAHMVFPLPSNQAVSWSDRQAQANSCLLADSATVSERAAWHP